MVAALQGLWPWGTTHLYSGHAPYSMISMYTAVETVGELITSVLTIVGIALLIAQLPTAQRRE